MIRKSLMLAVIIDLLSIHSFAQPVLKVLPLGNSITRGDMCLNGTTDPCDNLSNGDAIGYRLRLYDLMINAGYNIDYTGNGHFGYNYMADPDNGGFSGIRDNQLADIMESGITSFPFGQVTPGPYLDYFPADIILLHIGSNDVMADDYNSVSDVARLLDAIDDYETENNRPILVFLARIISLRDYPCNTNYGIKTYNNKLVSMAQSRISSGDKIVIVDMECGAGLNYYNDIIDPVHPNQTGYDKMADKWFEAINSINTAPVVSHIPDQSVDRGSAFTQISLDNYVSDLEDDPQDMTWSTYPYNPVNFYVTIDANRVATITPRDPEWSGTETIEFVAMDMGKVVPGLQKTDNSVTQFTLRWTPEIKGQQPITIPENTPYEITLNKLIIVDPENAPPGLQVIVDNGQNYTVAGSTITPALNYSGQLSVPVQLDDNGKKSNTYILTVEVSQVNFPPVITSTPVSSVNTNEQYIYAVVASDPDPGDILTYSASQIPDWLQINASTGLVSGTPSSDDSGNYDIRLQVSDGNYVVPQNYSLEVTYINHPPSVITDPIDSAKISEVYTYGIQATDPEGDPVFYFASTIPDWLEFNPQSHVLIGVPAQANIGLNLVVLGVTDLKDTAYQAYNLYVTSATGLSDHGTVPDITVYPNPASSYIRVESGDGHLSQGSLAFVLFDLTGKKVLQRELHGPSVEIRLQESGLDQGIYIYRVIDLTGGTPLQNGKIIYKY